MGKGTTGKARRCKLLVSKAIGNRIPNKGIIIQGVVHQTAMLKEGEPTVVQ